MLVSEAREMASIVWLIKTFAVEVAGATGAMIVIGGWLAKRMSKPLDAFNEEVARLKAQERNIDNLLEQTKKLTETTEVIKNNINDRVWDRQQRWTRRHDRYVEIVHMFEAYTFALNEVLAFRKLIDQKDDPSLSQVATNENPDAIKAVLSAFRQLTGAINVGYLEIGEECWAVLVAYLEEVPIIDPTSFASTQAGLVATIQATSNFRDAARADLGYELIRRVSK